MFWILMESLRKDSLAKGFFVTQAASIPLHWVIPHMVRHLPLPIRLLPQNVQEHAFVRRARRLTVLHCGPSHFIRPPHISDLSIAADTLWRHHQLCDLGWRGIWREPVFVQSLLPDARLVSVRRQQHAVIGEESAHTIRISLEPSFFVLAVDLLYLCHIFRGQTVSGDPDPRKNQQQANRWQYFADFH